MVKPGYKQTEIGLIPEDWETSTLETQYNITSSKRVFQSEWRDSGVPFYRAREIAVMGEGIPAPKDLYISEEMYERYSKQYGAIKENDVLITGVGTLGKVYVVKKDDRFYFKDGNIIWLQWNGRYSSQFLKQLYRTPVLIDQIFGNAGGSTVPTYTITNAKATVVPCPEYQEQCEIAEALSAADALISTIEKQISKKKAIKQGAMQELLTGKRRLPGFSGEWKRQRFCDVCEIVACMVDPTRSEYANFPHIGNESIEKSTGRIIGFNRVKDDQLISGKYLFTENDVLYGKINPHFAKVTFPKFCGLCSADMYPISCKAAILPEYLLYVMLSSDFTTYTMSLSKRSGIPKVNRDELAEYSFDLPPKSEQAMIANVLNGMDTEIDALILKLEKYRQVKQGMMQQLLTGKIRLV